LPEKVEHSPAVRGSVELNIITLGIWAGRNL
jgi:hypothetical protein